MKLIKIKLSDLKPYDKNPRDNKKAVDIVIKLITKYGYRNPIIINQDNVIVCGHTRYEALKKLGETEVFVLQQDFDDSDLIGYNIADNKSSEYASWDYEQLEQNIRELFSDLDSNLSKIDFSKIAFDMEEIKLIFGLEEIKPDKEKYFIESSQMEVNEDEDYYDNPKNIDNSKSEKPRPKKERVELTKEEVEDQKEELTNKMREFESSERDDEKEKEYNIEVSIVKSITIIGNRIIIKSQSNNIILEGLISVIKR